MTTKEGTSLIFQQMTSLLHQLDNEQYTQALPVLNGASLGQHFRHILDFYLCLLKGIPTQYVDYCDRQRNPSIECSTEYTMGVLQDIFTQIEPLNERITIDVAPDFAPNETDRTLVCSSLGRELMYAFDHTLHHLALLKIGLQTHFPELPIDETLGVAPSTLQYRSKSASC